MELTLHIPDDIAPRLQAAGGDLPRRALEALALEEYKTGHISKADLRRLLGFATRDQLDGFLKTHGVYEGYTVEEIVKQVEELQKLGF